MVQGRRTIWTDGVRAELARLDSLRLPYAEMAERMAEFMGRDVSVASVRNQLYKLRRELGTPKRGYRKPKSGYRKPDPEHRGDPTAAGAIIAPPPEHEPHRPRSTGNTASAFRFNHVTVADVVVDGAARPKRKDRPVKTTGVTLVRGVTPPGGTPRTFPWHKPGDAP